MGAGPGARGPGSGARGPGAWGPGARGPGGRGPGRRGPWPRGSGSHFGSSPRDVNRNGRHLLTEGMVDQVLGPHGHHNVCSSAVASWFSSQRASSIDAAVGADTALQPHSVLGIALRQSGEGRPPMKPCGRAGFRHFACAMTVRRGSGNAAAKTETQGGGPRGQVSAEFY